jgi:hypothetical protein
MPLGIRRKVIYLLAAASLALMLAGTTLTAPVFADCTTSGASVCGG